MFTVGAGVVQTEHFKKMGIPQEDSWLDFIPLLSVDFFVS